MGPIQRDWYYEYARSDKAEIQAVCGDSTGKMLEIHTPYRRGTTVARIHVQCSPTLGLPLHMSTNGAWSVQYESISQHPHKPSHLRAKI